MTDKLQDFLKELTELSRRYHLVIGGCGCCDSPWVEEGFVGKDAGYACVDKLQMVSPGDFEWDKEGLRPGDI